MIIKELLMSYKNDIFKTVLEQHWDMEHYLSEMECSARIGIRTVAVPIM